MPLSEFSVARPRSSNELGGVGSIVTGVTVVGALYFAREILIPFALAVLISFVLAPLTNQLRKTGLPRGACVVVVVTLSFGIILGAGAIGASQIAQLAENLPQYQTNLREKIRTIKGATSSSGAVSQATKVIEDLGREMATTKAGAQPVPTAGSTPIPVEIHSPNNNPLKVVSEFLQPLLGPLAGTGIVLVFVIFLLLQRQDLRDRVIRLLGTKSLHRTTDAMDEAAVRLSRYFLLQTMLNAGFGAVVGLGLWLIGVPSPWLWGIFTMLLRFVPYIGSIIAAVLPVALAAAVDPGWTMAGWTIALFAIGEPLMGHVVEPLVFGHQTGLSSVAIVIAATFWTWLWGPIGLIVATPLTLCLVILGQYTQRLEFLSVLLGDQPPLTPSEGFYQRLIAGDAAEVIDQAEEQLKEKSLVDFYDQVAIPGLELAQRDVRAEDLGPERQTLLIEGVQQLTENITDSGAADVSKNATPSDLSLSDAASSKPSSDQLKSKTETEWQTGFPILNIAGNNRIDRAAAALFTHACTTMGLSARLPEGQGLAGIAEIAPAPCSIKIVCVSYVGQARTSQVRFTVGRIRRRCPGTKVLLGLWSFAPGDPELDLIKTQAGADYSAVSFREALSMIEQQGKTASSVTAKGGDSRLEVGPTPSEPGPEIVSAQGA